MGVGVGLLRVQEDHLRKSMCEIHRYVQTTYIVDGVVLQRICHDVATGSHPSHSNVFVQQLQSILVMQHLVFRDEDSVRCISSWSRVILVIVMLSNLSAKMALDTVSRNDQVALDPFAALKLNSSLKVRISLDHFMINPNVDVVVLSSLKEGQLQIATVDDSQGSTVSLGDFRHQRGVSKFGVIFPSTERVLGHEVATLCDLRKNSQAAKDASVVGSHLDSCSNFCDFVDLFEDYDIVAGLFESYRKGQRIEA